MKKDLYNNKNTDLDMIKIDRNKYMYIEAEILEKCKKIVCNYKSRKNKISDIDIDIDLEENNIYNLPNILVFKSKEETIDFENIFSSVKILISDYNTIGYNKWLDIPENIEYIIVEGKIYRNNKKNKLEMAYFMKTIEIINYIEEVIIPEDKINEETYNKNTVIDVIIDEIWKVSESNYKLKDKLEELFMIIIERIDKEKLNKKYENNYTILNYIDNETIIIRL